jgi:nucleotide-binding universal stress UspA family protein
MVTAHQISPLSQVKIETIAVLTDFSSGAEMALRCAVEFARAYHAGLVLAHAYNPISAFVTPEAALTYQPLDDMRQAMQDRLLGQTEASFLQGVNCTTLLSMGEALNLLEDLKHVDLIVVGTSGEAGLVKAAIGSTAERIFRSSTTPVLTVGPHCRCTGKGEAAVRTVLYSTDFSPGADIALPYAVSLAKKNEAELVLLHVKDDKDVPFSFDRAMVSEEPLERLRGLVPEDGDLHRGPTCFVGFGKPDAVILDEANRRNADLIVMGARGTGALTSIVSHFGGGTAYRVAASARCPVLTIRT